MFTKKSLPLLCVLTSSCVSIPNAKVCATAGTILAGADCAWTNTGTTSELTFGELIEMLEPVVCGEGEENCTERAGAVIMSSEHYSRQKTAIEKACVELKYYGSKCDLELNEDE